jgi:hypothetical protein
MASSSPTKTQKKYILLSEEDYERAGDSLRERQLLNISCTRGQHDGRTRAVPGGGGGEEMDLPRSLVMSSSRLAVRTVPFFPVNIVSADPPEAAINFL